jgi:glutaredoxin
MFTVYTKDNCTYCDQAKQLLTSKGIPYIAIKVGEGISREELLAKIPSARTMPQIVKSDDTSSLYIGGFMELKKHLRAA